MLKPYLLKQPCQNFVRAFRLVSSPTRAAPRHETITISSAGTSGQMTLDVFRSSSRSQVKGLNSRNDDPIILFIPRGPLHRHARPLPGSTGIAPASPACNNLSPAALAQAAQATVVQVNYRLSSRHTYPTPIFDVLAGYEWVVQNLLPARSSTANDHFETIDHDHYYQTCGAGQEDAGQARLGVYGEVIGGSLAMMLSLTECKIGGKARIAAVAVTDAVLDWTFAEPVVSASAAFVQAKRQAKKSAKARGTAIDHTSNPMPTTVPGFSDQPATTPQLALSTLLNTRTSIFPRNKPSVYFSPFASPMHFLRTPATPIPDPAIEPPQSHARSRLYAVEPSLEDEEFALLAELEGGAAPSPTTAGHVNGDGSLAHQAPTSCVHTSNDTQTPKDAGVNTAQSDLAVAPSRHHPKRHRIPIRYPPSGTEPTLMPDVLLSISHNTEASNDAALPLLRVQSEEMARLLRRSWLKWGDGRDVAGALRAVEAEVDAGEGGGIMGHGGRDYCVVESEEDLDDIADEVKRRKKAEKVAAIAAERKIGVETVTARADESEDKGEAERIGEWFREMLRMDGAR